MPNIQAEEQRILRLITLWLTEIALCNAKDFYDINRISEGIACELLNLVYGLNLIDLNIKQRNYPGIDLADHSKGIAFQVTSRTDLKKVISTLKIVSQVESHPLRQVRFLILKAESKIKAGRASLSMFNDCFNFKNDIIYPSMLISDIVSLYKAGNPNYPKIVNLLYREFSTGLLNPELNLLANDQDRLGFYRSLFERLYAKDVMEYVDLCCNIQGNLSSIIPHSKIFFQINATIITGKSGFGKSTVMKWLAVESLQHDLIPIFIEAKYYRKNLLELLNGKCAEFEMSSAASFLNLLHRNSKVPILFIDGINECSHELRSKLILEICQLQQNLAFKIAVSVQEYGSGLDVLNCQRVTIVEPDLEIKRAIVLRKRSANEADKMTPVLSAVKTCLEASILSDLDSIDILKMSRFEIFESYARKKIGTDYHQILKFLSVLGCTMSDGFTFSLPISVIESHFDQFFAKTEVMSMAISSGFLMKNQNQISFYHEMYLDFFVANFISRFSSLGHSDMVKELNAPKNKKRQLFIVGAIESYELLEDLLPEISSADLLTSLALGEGGEYAKSWIYRRVDMLFEKIEEETSEMTFALTGEHFFKFKVENIAVWNPNEWALIQVILTLSDNTVFLQSILHIIGIADRRLALAFSKLKEQANANDIFSVREVISMPLYSSK